MTANQVAYANLLESRRHNVVSENEVSRHNIETETETKRANLAHEGIEMGKLNETRRHNVVTETESHRHNVAEETERQRHNQADEKRNAWVAQSNHYLGLLNHNREVDKLYWNVKLKQKDQEIAINSQNIELLKLRGNMILGEMGILVQQQGNWLRALPW